MSEMKPNEFRCAVCKGVFENEWADEEAMSELGENFPGTSKESCASVCDDCYQQVMGWTQTAEGRAAYEAELNAPTPTKERQGNDG